MRYRSTTSYVVAQYLVFGAILFYVLSIASHGLAAPELTVYAVLDATAPGAEEGEYFTDFDLPYVTPNGKVVFEATAGTGQFSNGFTGVWMGDETNLDLLVSTRNALPGFEPEARITGLSTIASRGEGNLLFLSQVQSATNSRELVLWNIENGELALIARANDFAPSPSNVIFARVTGLGSTVAGQVLYQGGHDLVGGNNSLWLYDNGNRRQILAERGPSPAEPERIISIIPELTTGAFIHPDGQLTVQVKIAGRDGPWQILTGPPGDLQVAFSDNTPAPGVLDANLHGLPFNGISSTMKVNDFGSVAFQSALVGPNINQSNNTGLWAGPLDDLELIARYGDQAPGLEAGFVFSDFDDEYLLSNGGDVAFNGRAVRREGDSFEAKHGLWRKLGDDLELVASTGDILPGLSEDSPVVRMGFFAMNAAGQIVFTTAFQHPANANQTLSGIWEVGPDGIIEPLAFSGMEIELQPGDLRTVSRFGSVLPPRSPWRLQSLSDSGFLVGEIAFEEGGSAIVGFQIQIPEPNSILLALTIPILLLSLRSRSNRVSLT